MEDLKKDVYLELENLGINANVIIDEIDEGIQVSIAIKKPYNILETDFQDILISYLVYKLKDSIGSDETIKFVVFLDKEEKINVREVGYDFKMIQNLEYSSNVSFLNLINNCLKNFEKGDVTRFNYSIISMSNNFPEVVEKKTFFNLLYDFSKNNDKTPESNIDESTLILLYFYYLDTMKEVDDLEYVKSAKRIVKIIPKLWYIKKGTDINEEEYRLSEILLKNKRNKDYVRSSARSSMP
ncbi:hypothetical protein GCM10022393_18660 [Aquimarina addita]|uniref:DUF4365 domain-containing protein n=1 Tax=Aquimarina addita TaxID=870485 RepID=A0ABP6UK88_9FLAO